jgi:hypothetical protein
MSGSYSRDVSFSAAGGVPTCVVLPVSMRGTLDRLIIRQVSGTGVTFQFVVYDRRSACAGQIDLHVQGGDLVGGVNNGGQVQFETEEDHNLKVGDTLHVSESDVSGYNDQYHTVISVESDTEFTTDVAYSSDATGGIWQTPPLDEYPLLHPAVHRVFSGSGLVDTTFESYDIDRNYENRDNQDVTARRRTSALYLEITPGGTGAKTWVASVTTSADIG